MPSSRPCAEDADHDRRGSVDGVHATGVEVGVAVGAHDVAVVADVAPLAVVGGDDADAVERLREVGQHVGDAVAAEQVALLRGAMEPDGKHEEQRDDQQDGPRRERDVGGEEHDGDDDHRESLQSRTELMPSWISCWRFSMSLVMRLIKHAGLLLGEEVEAEALEVDEDPDSQVVHHPRGELAR